MTAQHHLAGASTQLFHLLEHAAYNRLGSCCKSLHLTCIHTAKTVIRRSGLFFKTANWDDEPLFATQSKVRVQYWEHCLQVDRSIEYVVEPYDATLSNDGEIGEIQRDLPRTFPNHPYFETTNGKGQQALGRVLRALRTTYPDVGYSQGMNFVVGVFLILVSAASLSGNERMKTKTTRTKTTRTKTATTTMATTTLPKRDWVATASVYVQQEHTLVAVEKGNARHTTVRSHSATTATTATTAATTTPKNLSIEKRSFHMMCSLIEKRGMNVLWSPGMPGLKVKISQLNEIMSTQLPSLQRHMQEVGLMPDFFASKWFLTLHTYTLPLQLVFVVWDSFVNDGWKSIFRGGLAMLKQQEKQLLVSDMGEIAMLFNKKVGLPTSPQRGRRFNQQGRSSINSGEEKSGERETREKRERRERRERKEKSHYDAFYQAYGSRTLKVTRSGLHRAEVAYKQRKLMEMIRLSTSSTPNGTRSTSDDDNGVRNGERKKNLTTVMKMYDDPSASSTLGPSAAAMVRHEYELIELAAEEDTRMLRDRLEVSEF